MNQPLAAKPLILNQLHRKSGKSGIFRKLTTDRHIAQQKAVETMIQMRFPNQPHLRYVNLGRAVDLRDKSLCWDGIHLTEEGQSANRRRPQSACFRFVAKLRYTI